LNTNVETFIENISWFCEALPYAIFNNLEKNQQLDFKQLEDGLYIKQSIILNLDKTYSQLGYYISEALIEAKVLERKDMEIQRTSKGTFQQSKRLQLHEKFQAAVKVVASYRKLTLTEQQLKNYFTDSYTDESY
jgi:hypothetical protein